MAGCNFRKGHLINRRTIPVVGAKIAGTEKTATLLTNVSVQTMVGNVNDIAAKKLYDLMHPQERGIEIHAAPTRQYLPGVTDEAKRRMGSVCLATSKTGAVKDAHLEYKARPLDGIWATAPYLHNGSVPTLYDLLLPARTATTLPLGAQPSQGVSCNRDGKEKLCSRPEEFSVGSHEFDPRLVGFVSTQHLPGMFEFHVRDTHGAPVVGNFNSGHDYGTSLNDAERWELVEYLKTL